MDSNFERPGLSPSANKADDGADYLRRLKREAAPPKPSSSTVARRQRILPVLGNGGAAPDSNVQEAPNFGLRAATSACGEPSPTSVSTDAMSK